MPPFRCGTINQSSHGSSNHRPLHSGSTTWFRCLQAGGVANLHRLRHAAPKQLRQHGHSFAVFASATSTKTATRAPKAAHASDEEVLDCVIVGAGISGLTLAQALTSDHSTTVKNILITEAQDRVGGNIISKRTLEGFQYEEGPNSFQPSDAVLKLALDVGVVDELQLGDPKSPRFVWWEKKLRPTPSGPDVLTFDLLSIGGKLRAGLGMVGLRPKMPDQEESVEQYVRRNLGKEVFERLVEPFCSGVYAGDPSKLSMTAAFGKIHALEKSGGSIIGGAIKLLQDKKKNPAAPRDPKLPPKPKGQTVGSFRDGLKTLPEAIARKMGSRLKTSWKLREVSRGKNNTFTLKYDTPEGHKQVKTRTVALTVPAYVAADLLQGNCQAAAEKLRSFDYPPVAAISLSYPLSSIRDDRKDKTGEVPGFGQLHPRSQGITTLGTIYSSSVFPNRAPQGEHLVLNFIGGATNRGIVEQSQQDLVNQVDKDLRVMLVKPDAPAPKTVAFTLWKRAIPQFNIHHLDDVMACKQDLAKQNWQGFFLSGNYVSGVALGKCVEYGYTLARELALYLDSDGSAAHIARPETAQDEAFYEGEVPVTVSQRK